MTLSRTPNSKDHKVGLAAALGAVALGGALVGGFRVIRPAHEKETQIARGTMPSGYFKVLSENSSGFTVQKSAFCSPDDFQRRVMLARTPLGSKALLQIPIALKDLPLKDFLTDEAETTETYDMASGLSALFETPVELPNGFTLVETRHGFIMKRIVDQVADIVCTAEELGKGVAPRLETSLNTVLEQAARSDVNSGSTGFLTSFVNIFAKSVFKDDDTVLTAVIGLNEHLRFAFSVNSGFDINENDVSVTYLADKETMLNAAFKRCFTALQDVVHAVGVVTKASESKDSALQLASLPFFREKTEVFQRRYSEMEKGSNKSVEAMEALIKAHKAQEEDASQIKMQAKAAPCSRTSTKTKPETETKAETETEAETKNLFAFDGNFRIPLTDIPPTTATNVFVMGVHDSLEDAYRKLISDRRRLFEEFKPKNLPGQPFALTTKDCQKLLDADQALIDKFSKLKLKTSPCDTLTAAFSDCFFSCSEVYTGFEDDAFEFLDIGDEHL